MNSIITPEWVRNELAMFGRHLREHLTRIRFTERLTS